MEYSIKKGAKKGLTSALIVMISIVTFSGFFDVTLWSLVEQYLKPLVSSMTVGGLLTMALNYLKVKNELSA